MLIRTEQEFEIWNDPPQYGAHRLYLLAGFGGAFVVLGILLFSIVCIPDIKAYIVLPLGIIPAALMIIGALLVSKNIYRKEIILRINNERIEIFKKDKNIIIKLLQITQVETYVNSLVIRYKEEGKETESKYNLSLSPANVSLTNNALVECRKNCFK